MSRTSLKGGQLFTVGLIRIANGALTGTQTKAVSGGTGSFRGAEGEIAIKVLGARAEPHHHHHQLQLGMTVEGGLEDTRDQVSGRIPSRSSVSSPPPVVFGSLVRVGCVVAQPR
jgi:hypothetical protein